jgi:DNA-binding CsgD family transcriptional regulator
MKIKLNGINVKIIVFIFININIFNLIYSNNKNQQLDSLLKKSKELTTLNPLEGLNFIDSVLEIAIKSSDYHAVGSLLNDRGSIFYLMGVYDKAFSSFIEALNYYERAKDSIGIAYIHNNLALVMYSLKKYDDALNYLIKSYNYFENKGSYKFIIDIYNNIASLLQMKNLNKESLFLLKKAEKIALDSLYYESLPNIYNNIGVAFEHMNQNDSAIYYYHKAINFKRQNLNINIALMFQNLYNYYLKINNIDSALKYADSAYYYSKKFNGYNIIASSSLDLAKLYEKKNNTDKAYIFLKEYAKWRDSIDIFSSNDVYFDFIMNNSKKEFEQKMMMMQNRIKLQRTIQIISLISIILAILVFSISYKYLKSRNKIINQQKQLLEFEQQQTMLEMESQKQQLYIQNIQHNFIKQQLENDLAAKERELTSITLNLANKIEILNNIQKELSFLLLEYPQISSNRHINNISQIIKLNINDKNIWDTYFYHFEKVYPNFFNNIKKNYNITNSELRLCAYLLINLSNKEIARLLYISESSVKMKKNRLAKKFNLSDASELYDFLLTLVEFDNTEKNENQ